MWRKWDRPEGCGWGAQKRGKSKVSGWMTENKGSGEPKMERDEWCRKARREEHRSKERRRKKRESCEAGRVTFTVRADQFPVPSIIDVTSAVGFYLSGLTNRNTIPSGSTHHRRHTHTHTHTHTQSKNFTPSAELIW